MLFKDLKPNYPIYALLRGDNTQAMQGKVLNVNGPHIEQGTTVGKMAMAQMMVDVTVEIDGKTATYSIPETLAVTYAGNLVLSVDRDGILREVEAIKMQKEEALKNVPRDRKIVEDCEAILAEWNPAFKEKKETEERFCKLENSLEKLTGLVSGFIEEFKK